MMSSQTKDQVTFSTLKYLVEEKDLSIEVIQKASEAEVNEWIKNVGFHNNKAKFIKKTTNMIVEKFNSKVPDNFNDLISLPGVGPKMAHLVLQHAF